MPEAYRILDIGYAQFKDTSGADLQHELIDVVLRANDVAFSRDELQDQSYGATYICLKPSTPGAEMVTMPGTIIQETDAETYSAISGQPIRLLNHQTSRSLSLQGLADLSRCRAWVEECGDAHADCSKIQSDATTAQGKANERFKLIELASRNIVELGNAIGVSYATLSYVCGRSDTLWKLPKASKMWTRDLSGRKTHPLPANIPRTIADAMTIADRVGFRYLWVDSFCITQDDPVELQAQIGAMLDIYTRASICIVAASAEDSHAGIPGVSRLRQLDQGCQIQLKEGMMIGLPQPSFSDLLKPYKWMNRAWTYQELILSKRCLIFTEREAFFYCASMTCRESYAVSGGEQWSKPGSDTFRIGNSVVIQTTGHERKADELCRTYTAAVEEFSRRELSYQTDGLKAFQGLSELLGRTMDTKMIYGCPKDMLVNSLTWQRTEMTVDVADHPQRRMMARPIDNDSDRHLRPLFPSWAWVGWKGHLRLQLFSYYFWGSEMHILDRELVPSIPASLDMKFSFMTSDEVGDGSSPFLHGLLPIFTKFASLRVVPDEDVPGCLEIQASSKEYAGFVDARGQEFPLDSKRSRGHFIQIWAEQKRGKPNMVNVMLVETHTLPTINGMPGEQSLRQSLQESHILNTAAPLTAQRMRSDDAKFALEMSGDCPPEIRIGSSSKPETACLQAILVSRVGVGYVNIDAWIEAKPSDTIVLLG